MSRFATILATGRYVPERVVTNAELEQRLGEPVHQWLIKNVGIEARHVMADDQVTSDLAAAAARQALARAGLEASDIDLIIVATDTPDYPSPATACVVQARLSAWNAGTFDVNAACSGWVTALDIGAKFIASDPRYRHVLVIGAYGMTRYLDWSDKTTATLFADGAGAVVLGASSEPGLLASKLKADGSYHDALGIYTGGTFRPSTPEVVNRLGRPRVQFVRRFPPTFNTDHWPALVREVVERAELTLDDVSLFLFTQLNLRTIEACMAALAQPVSKAHWIMHKWGYTGSACIPMVLDDAVEQGRLKPGDHVVFCASGGGIAMAAAAMLWTG